MFYNTPVECFKYIFLIYEGEGSDGLVRACVCVFVSVSFLSCT